MFVVTYHDTRIKGTHVEADNARAPHAGLHDNTLLGAPPHTPRMYAARMMTHMRRISRTHIHESDRYAKHAVRHDTDAHIQKITMS